MKIGFIVDGDAEYHSLQHALKRIRTPYSLIHQPLKAPVQPYASPSKVALDALPALKLLALGRHADLVVLLIDRETRSDCAPDLATRIASAFGTQCVNHKIKAKVAVVVKDRTFENWLISDTEALRRVPRRFKFPQKVLQSVENGRADQLDGLSLLRSAAIESAYDKVQDAQKILRHADPLRMANTSRSFRRLMRVVGSAAYEKQSRQPVRKTER